MIPEMLTRLQRLTEAGEAGACCELLRHYTRAGEVSEVEKWGRMWLSLEGTQGKAAERRQVGHIMAAVVPWSGWGALEGGNGWPLHWITGKAEEHDAPRVELVTPKLAEMERSVRASLARCMRYVFTQPVGDWLKRAITSFSDQDQRVIAAGFWRVARLINNPVEYSQYDGLLDPTLRLCSVDVKKYGTSRCLM